MAGRSGCEKSVGVAAGTATPILFLGKEKPLGAAALHAEWLGRLHGQSPNTGDSAIGNCRYDEAPNAVDSLSYWRMICQFATRMTSTPRIQGGIFGSSGR